MSLLGILRRLFKQQVPVQCMTELTNYDCCWSELVSCSLHQSVKSPWTVSVHHASAVKEKLSFEALWDTSVFCSRYCACVLAAFQAELYGDFSLFPGWFVLIHWSSANHRCDFYFQVLV